jgi:hypothetical protein
MATKFLFLFLNAARGVNSSKVHIFTNYFLTRYKTSPKPKTNLCTRLPAISPTFGEIVLHICKFHPEFAYIKKPSPACDSRAPNDFCAFLQQRRRMGERLGLGETGGGGGTV